VAEADPQSYHHLRSDVRFPTDFRAVLHWDDNFSCVQVANIASSGMRLIGRLLPKQNERVRVAANGLEVCGRVVWRTPHSCAVILEQSIDPLAVVRANCFARHLGAKDKLPLDRIAPNVEPCKIDGSAAVAARAGSPRWMPPVTVGTARPAFPARAV